MVIPTVRPSDRREAEPVHAVIHKLEGTYCQRVLFRRHSREIPMPHSSELSFAHLETAVNPK